MTTEAAHPRTGRRAGRRPATEAQRPDAVARVRSPTSLSRTCARRRLMATRPKRSWARPYPCGRASSKTATTSSRRVRPAAQGRRGRRCLRPGPHRQRRMVGHRTAGRDGPHDLVVQAWTDRYATWAHRAAVKLAARQDVHNEIGRGGRPLVRVVGPRRGGGRRRAGRPGPGRSGATKASTTPLA